MFCLKKILTNQHIWCVELAGVFYCTGWNSWSFTRETLSVCVWPISDCQPLFIYEKWRSPIQRRTHTPLKTHVTSGDVSGVHARAISLVKECGTVVIPVMEICKRTHFLLDSLPLLIFPGFNLIGWPLASKLSKTSEWPRWKRTYTQHENKPVCQTNRLKMNSTHYVRMNKSCLSAQLCIFPLSTNSNTLVNILLRFRWWLTVSLAKPTSRTFSGFGSASESRWRVSDNLKITCLTLCVLTSSTLLNFF